MQFWNNIFLNTRRVLTYLQTNGQKSMNMSEKDFVFIAALKFIITKDDVNYVVNFHHFRTYLFLLHQELSTLWAT